MLACLISVSVQAQDTYSRENPQVVECNTCFSAGEFEVQAEDAVPTNHSRHVIVFNPEAQEFRTFFVMNNYEPELGISIKVAQPLSNLPEHETQFNEYLQAVTSQSFRSPIELEYPTDRPDSNIPSNDIAAIADYSNWARGQASVNRALQSIFIPRVPVKITFQNGWSVYLMIEARSSVHHLIMITDEDGNVIETHVNYGSGSTGSGSGGGSSAGSVNATNVTITTSAGAGRSVRVCVAIDGEAPSCLLMLV